MLPATYNAAVPCSRTVTVTSSVTGPVLSSADSSNVYVPTPGNVAVVSTAVSSPNVTPAGPPVWFHSVVTAPGGFGSPSSPTVASRLTVSVGNMIV